MRRSLLAAGTAALLLPLAGIPAWAGPGTCFEPAHAEAQMTKIEDTDAASEKGAATSTADAAAVTAQPDGATSTMSTPAGALSASLQPETTPVLSD